MPGGGNVADIDGVRPIAGEQDHRVNGLGGENAVVLSSGVDRAGIAGLQYDGVVAGTGGDAHQPGPGKDAIVAGEPDDGAGARVA